MFESIVVFECWTNSVSYVVSEVYFCRGRIWKNNEILFRVFFSLPELWCHWFHSLKTLGHVFVHCNFLWILVVVTLPLVRVFVFLASCSIFLVVELPLSMSSFMLTVVLDFHFICITTTILLFGLVAHSYGFIHIRKTLSCIRPS